ncbi:response regulator transcription factor [Fusibacter bizertensis]|jgi:Response regulators consisting of a CheY-like receiver domain and a winged-helix DNA-binding domain|uniref:Response regulator transcription factor n=1 Tax=Fusibacter bizertensis TaxID=1488331 RepID=A0ABT6NA59_9FIRM|nr:response regulator transcription factor [Fusibacter bizertensis]MDH8677295.1 response regulator transcription factor [Fusibacter bizertensis]
MSNHKVIVVDDENDHFDALHSFLAVHDIDYQRYPTFDTYLDEHHLNAHILIADSKDILSKFPVSKCETEQNYHKLYNCTYLIAYEPDNCHETLKKALIHGADDYVLFPLHHELLCLKIRSQQKKLAYLEELYAIDQNTIVHNNMAIDPFSKQIFMNGKRMDLTQSEFNILYTLAKKPSEVFSMEYLFQMITGQKSLGDYNALMTHVSRLRKKLAQIDPSHHYIVTVRNRGYKFNAHKGITSPEEVKNMYL